MNRTPAACVSVIIPAYNASATIGRALEALSKQNCFQPFEVIVIDDGSKDNTSDIVRSFSAVKCVYQDNAGPAAARNHGAQIAQGEFLAFTDSDCIPHEDWISNLLSGFAQEHTGVVAGSYGIANSSSLLARCIYKEILWRHVHLMPDFPKAFGSYNFCVKRNVFAAVGGFNVSYRRASGEDNDLSYKIIKSGWRIFFERKALVDHYHPVFIGKYLREQFQHGYWRVKMYKDHPLMMGGDGYTFWKDMAELPWVAFLFIGLVAGICHLMRSWDFSAWAVILFLTFEIVWAWIITGSIFDGIYFGGVLFFRAIARAFGFSTGIIFLLFQKE